MMKSSLKMKLFLDRASHWQRSFVGFCSVTVVRGRGIRYGEEEWLRCDVMVLGLS